MTASDPLVPALSQRLRAAAVVLLDELPAAHGDPLCDAGILLDLIVRSVQARPGEGRLWLLLVALTGEFPLHEDFEAARRMLELSGPVLAQVSLLDQSLAAIAASGDMGSVIELVTDRPVVDVTFSARHELLTGIQRVVRHTVPRWVGRHQMRLCSWTKSGTITRELTPSERDSLLGATDARSGRVSESASTPEPPDEGAERILVPWHVPVILPEVPNIDHIPRLAALARHSGSPLALIAYDCIPVVSADLVEPDEHAKFISYLNVVKYARTAVCISAAASEEFAGFVDMIAAQGITGPRILTCSLPNGAEVEDVVRSGRESEAVGADEIPTRDIPTVVSVGSIDRRKNQIVLLEAAEVLWREGHRFRLRFLGSGGVAPPEFSSWIAELIALGRPVTVESGVSDSALGQAIRSARFTVFTSLHEGFGLPIAESLAVGTPVIAAHIGSMREIADHDGALFVDPRDPEAVTDAVRRLLNDDGLVAELAARARSRRRRTWDEYAGEVWEALVGDGAGPE